MKKIIRLTELDLHRIVKESVKKILTENYMSDKDIENQYGGMQIENFVMEPTRDNKGWSGYFELVFPNADNVDYDDYMENHFICYDMEGNEIAWDNWMPDEQTNKLQDIIKKEIEKMR